MTSPWKAYPLPGDDPLFIRIGSLHLWIRSTTDELWLAYRHQESANGAEATSEPSAFPVPEDLQWHRWTFSHKSFEFHLRPIFPDLPVVVKPEYPFRVTPEVRTKIYIRVPLWVQVRLKDTVITEIPSVVLSHTWFGSFTDGELCYWISSAARKKIDPDPTRPFLAICPVHIRNRSDEELLVEKICLRVKWLSLYLLEDQLWANEARVNYRGRESVSEIEVFRRPPPEAPGAKLITPPREESRSFAAKTFASLKELPGLGMLR
ncbi:MAG: DUF432 domain-containing protein [Calditrichaeota bacterium]|nr:MAG: DUF432 domain-containing protein [Calditrichota bacterium]